MIGDLNETEYDEIDIETGRVIHGVKVSSYMKGDNYIDDYIKIKFIEYENTHNKQPSKEIIAQFREQAIKEANTKRSYDLPKVLKVYMANMITHKHKMNILDTVEIARESLEDIQELVVSPSGSIQKTRAGDNRVKQGLKNMKQSLDYAIDAFKNQPIHSVQGVSKEKSYSHLDKIKLDELLKQKDLLQARLHNGRISQSEFDERVAVIDDQIKKLGGYNAMSKWGENMLKYSQLKGMGFNVIAGGVNLTTGWMENSIRAADGRFFNTTQLSQSYRDVFSTIYDPYRKNKTTKKIIAIEKLFSCVEDPSQELYSEQSKLTETAYIITKKTEFVNIMSMTGAFLRNIPVTNNKGEKSNLFEAIDENGKIKEGYKLHDKKSNDQFLFDVSMMIHELIKKSHGNYKDKLMGKKTVLGQMAFQFRTWMPELYRSRWGKNEYSDILQKEFKGRWRSYKSLGGSEFNGNAFTAVDNTLYTLGQLCRKIAFMRTSFDGRMSETDAANMRANLMELHFALGMLALMLILRAAIPDDERKKNFTYNMLINLITRQQNDILVFANPITFDQINKNMLPVMSIVSDTQSLVRSVKNEFSDDDKKRGKSLVKTAKMIPGLSQGVRVFQYGEKEIAQ